jgi:hypothetical protein
LIFLSFWLFNLVDVEVWLPPLEEAFIVESSLRWAHLQLATSKSVSGSTILSICACYYF